MSRAWSIRTSRIPFRHPNPSRPVTRSPGGSLYLVARRGAFWASWEIWDGLRAWEALTGEYSDEPEPMSKAERRKRWLERRAEKQQERRGGE